MQSYQELLSHLSKISDPCEDIRQQAIDIAAGNEGPADLIQASTDLAAAIDHVFEIATYILKSVSADVHRSGDLW